MFFFSSKRTKKSCCLRKFLKEKFQPHDEEVYSVGFPPRAPPGVRKKDDDEKKRKNLREKRKEKPYRGFFLHLAIDYPAEIKKSQERA